MADIMLHTSVGTGFTCISNTFIDDYMKDANGEYVKIYLYLLRFLNRVDVDFSISQLADCLDHTEKDVMRAFTYWEKVGLLRLEYGIDGELSGICLVDVNEKDSFTSVNYAAAPTVAVSAGAPAVSNNTVMFHPNYSSEQLDSFKEEGQVQDLFFCTESYLGRPLSASDTNTILFWYDSLHMPIDLIQYLIESCISNGHSSFHYMDTVARNWAEDGITTLDAAVKSNNSHSNTVYSVKKALGIGNRELVESEINFINRWTNELGFDLDIITEACQRTIIQTNKPSFKYADSILSSWNNSGVKNMADIASLDQEFTKASVAKLSTASRAKSAQTNSSTASRTKSTNKFNNLASQRGYDFEALEHKLLGH